MILNEIFSGQWSFKRIIDGHETIKGEAKFTDVADNVKLYHEEGERGLIKFYQNNRYLFYGNVLKIYANGENLMHVLDLSTREAFHTYYCGGDIYKCRIKIVSEDEFEISYKVTGPKKDYTLVTSYYRL